MTCSALARRFFLSRFLSPKRTLSSTDRCGKSAYSWKTNPTFRFSGWTKVAVSETTFSPIEIDPASGLSKPQMSLSIVVFPQPLGPSIEKNEPLLTENDNPSNTGGFETSNDLLRLCTAKASIVGLIQLTWLQEWVRDNAAQLAQMLQIIERSLLLKVRPDRTVPRTNRSRHSLKAS